MRLIPRTPEYLELRAERRRVARRKWIEKNPEAMDLARQNWKRNNRAKVLQKRRERTERITGKKVIPFRRVSDEEKREKARVRSNRWYHANKAIVSERTRVRYALLPSFKKIRIKPTPEQHRARMEWQKIWRRKNRDKVRAYDLKASLNNPQRVIRNRLAARITKVLKRNRIRKIRKIVQLIGCTWAFLKGHIEMQFKEGMSWDNRSKWHIDHIRPCASFDLTDPSQQEVCFHWLNLRPLWSHENMAKGAKWRKAA